MKSTTMKIVFTIFRVACVQLYEVIIIPVRDSSKNDSMMEFENYGDAENYIRDILLPEFKSAHFQIQKLYKTS